MAMMTISTFKDRTNEFHSLCERKRLRSSTPNNLLEKRALLSSSPELKHSKRGNPRSEFSLMAAEIGRQITNTASKLDKLTKCKKRKKKDEQKKKKKKNSHLISGQEKDIIR